MVSDYSLCWCWPAWPLPTNKDGRWYLEWLRKLSLFGLVMQATYLQGVAALALSTGGSLCKPPISKGWLC